MQGGIKMKQTQSIFYFLNRFIFAGVLVAHFLFPSLLAQASSPARVLDTDMSITMTDSIDPVVAGRAFDYTLTIGNTGSDVTEVTVTDSLPAELDFLYATPSQGTCEFSDPVLTCNLGAMASGGTATVVVTVSANTGGTVTNEASVSANDTETNPGNNTDSENTTVNTGDGTICYAAAEDSSNTLVTVDRATWNGTAAPNGFGVWNIEAIAYWPGTNTLYAADADDFGVVNVSTGVYASIGSFGSADGALGTMTIDDVDGLTFDPFTGILYGSQRRDGNGNDDLLIQIDPATGAVVQDAFGAGVDYVVIPAVNNRNDVDDIAISSVDGTMYATQNDSSYDRLIIVDKTDGSSTDVDRIREAGSGAQINDVEGLGYDALGNFYATTGDDSGSDSNHFWTMDPATAEMTLRSDLSGQGSDYEGADCLVDGVNTIAGTVFEDRYGDGALSPADPGTASVTVSLYRDTNGDGQVDGGDTLVATQDTDANGHYNFMIAAAGDFVLEIDTADLPAGHVMTTDNVETASFSDFGNADAFNDFGHVQPALIGNYVWNDTDGDGVQDAGEDGIAGVTVILSDGSCTIGVDCPTTTTDSDGYYAFSGLSAGTYTVIVDSSTLTAGAEQTGDPDAAFDNQHTVTVAAGDVYDDADFGYRWQAAIGNRVWLDEDGDGVQDAGEDGIPGVTVNLRDSNGTVIATTTTDANGEYIFTGLAAADYSVAVDTTTLPSGLAANQTGDPDESGACSVCDSTDSAISLAAAQEYMTADFGYNWVSSADATNPGAGATGALGDTIWNDADGDGVQDAGEAGIAGVTVTLYDDPDGDGVYDHVVGTTTTDSSGHYIFDGLSPAAYVVSVDSTTLPAGFNTAPTGDPDGDGDNTSEPIVIAPGDAYLNADFGYNFPGGHTIGDTVFMDADGDGVVDAGEPGIAGVTVTLLDGGGHPIATTVTDSDGNYAFPGLPDGSYTVWVNDTRNVLGGLTAVSDPDGGLDSRSAVTLSGADDLGQDFGYAPPHHAASDGLIGDTVFLDTDGNGALSAGEGLEGVSVRLYDTSSGALLSTVQTDENGRYFFGGLSAGNYRVVVDTTTLPSGLTNTIDPDGGTSDQSDVTLSAGEVNLAQDFGYTASTLNTLGGTLWNDADADGVLDGTETSRFQGVTVVLYDASGDIVATTTTDSSGDYAFTNLPDGTYRVDVTDDANVLGGYWHSTGPAAGDGSTDNNSQADPYSVALSGGVTHTLGDFGYYRAPAALGNFVWYDDDGDGVQDAGENGVSGVVVTLTITYPNGDTVTVVSVTDDNGAYDFSNLLLDESFNAAGGAGQPSYGITVSLPDGYDFTTQDAGSDEALDSDADTASGSISVPAIAMGETNNDLDAGLENSTLDYGDLPASYNITRLGDNGPRHAIGTLTLGAQVDADPDGQESPNASGDTGDDGVARDMSDHWTNGATVDVYVDLQGSTASGGADVGMWIDWNGDGDFADANEFTSYPSLGVGLVHTVQVTVPDASGYTVGDTLNVRVRAFDPANLPGGSLDSGDYVGLASNGEVEDYQWEFSPTAITLSQMSATSGAPHLPLALAGAVFVLVGAGLALRKRSLA